MTEEQIKSIEYLKEYIEIDKENIEICEENDFYEEAKHISERVKHFETILDYISELEEENEKYKNFQLHINGMRSGKELLTRYINDSILKDKIRDKIKEYQINIKKYEYADRNIFNENNIRQEVITVLNSLLEGE